MKIKCVYHSIILLVQYLNHQLVSNIENYPNPQRLFIKLRDNWFFDQVEKFEIPLHLFVNIRNSQLGQLALLIQSNRTKMIRKGENPGPDIFDESTVSQLLPIYQMLTQLDNFLKSESEDLKLEIIIDETVISSLSSKLKELNVVKEEWNDIKIDDSRVDELFCSSYSIFHETILIKIKESLKKNSIEELMDIIKEKNPNLFQLLSEFHDSWLFNVLKNKQWEIDEETKQRKVKKEDEEIMLNNSQIKQLSLQSYSFQLELIRYVENKEIKINYSHLIPILTLEMLIKIPYPDKTLIPLVRENLDLLKKSNRNKDFYDLLFIFYQLYSFGTNKQNASIINRIYKNAKTNFRLKSKNFWKKIVNESDEKLITVLWSAFSVSQVQLNNKINQNPNEFDKFTSNMLSNLNQIFWNQGRSYLNKHDTTSIPFWAKNILITSKQISTAKQSLENFNELNDLVLRNDLFKSNSHSIDLNIYDKYTIIQRVLSYGLESRSLDIFDTLKDYVNILKQVLMEMGENNTFDLDISKEKSAVDEIEKFIMDPKYPIDE